MMRLIGTYVKDDGYRRMIFSDEQGNRTNKYEHVFIYEERFGPKPKGYIIHHIDGDRANNSLDNLELLTYADHLRTHRGWTRINGAWHKRCSGCGGLFPVLLGYWYFNKLGNPTGKCVSCAREKARWYRLNMSEDRKNTTRKYKRLWARQNRKSRAKIKEDNGY